MIKLFFECCKNASRSYHFLSVENKKKIWLVLIWFAFAFWNAIKLNLLWLFVCKVIHFSLFFGTNGESLFIYSTSNYFLNHFDETLERNVNLGFPNRLLLALTNFLWKLTPICSEDLLDVEARLETWFFS
jgi:hypothetical protein